MSSPRKSLLDWACLEGEEQEHLVVKPELMMVIADRLEEAIVAPSQEELSSLSSELIELFNRLFKQLPRPAANAVRGSSTASAEDLALYMIGQVGFAQGLAAKSSEKRVNDQFFEIIQDSVYQRYLSALFNGEHTGTQLSEVVQERQETVSRKLRKLRELGVTDFRRDGVSALNFLTPAGRKALESYGFKKTRNPTVREKINEIKINLESHMRAPMTFSSEKGVVCNG